MLNTAIKRGFMRSLTQQFTFALLLLFVSSAGVVGFTVYELDLRKHDYVILNLAGRLHALSQAMVSESLHYRQQQGAMASGEAATLYLANLRMQAESFDQIITALRQRSLPPELTGRSDPLVCSWDSQSIGQLNLTAQTWDEFRVGMEAVFMPNATIAQLEAAADYIIANDKWLIVVAKNLSAAFQHMMEGKMRLIVLFNQGAIVLFFISAATLLMLTYFTFVKPLRAIRHGISHIAQADFEHQIEVRSGNELGQVAAAFNSLSARLDGLFRLTDRINQATSIDTMLRFVFEEFRRFIPLDWVGLLIYERERNCFVLQRLHADDDTELREGDVFSVEGSLLQKALRRRKPLRIDDLPQLVAQNPQAHFAAKLVDDGRWSALFYPLGNDESWSAILAFSVKNKSAYQREHLEFLHNIAAQISHGFEKTVVTDSLIITAITGLAKLAENRDPETGDHLIRMSLYSAIVAEELQHDEKHAAQVNIDYVRDIQRFAPMHDIGKVGIADGILLKPGKLTDEEREEMERHPIIGGEVLRRCELQMNEVGHSVFRLGIEIAESHHEKYDGSGYPRGLSGDAIPLSARIVAVADVFDALTSKRPYKEAWPVERAVQHVQAEAGRHFDPRVVAALQRGLPRVLEVYERLKHV